jgi:hypothetical protein
VLANPQVELVFWGSNWNSGSNPTLRTNVTNAVHDIIGLSPYTDRLGQYGVGNGVLAGSAVTITSSSPGATFTDANVRTMLQNNIGGSIPYNSNWLYIVIPQPGSTDPSEGRLGYHSTGSVSGRGNFYYGWTENVGGAGAMDDITKVFSHEYVEGATDPDGTAWQVNPRSTTSWNEICDGEAQNYTFRVGSYLLQSYYSQQDNAYVVPNGSISNFLVSTTRELTFQGASVGANNIFINRVGGAVYAEFNSSPAQFEPGALSDVRVDSGFANNRIAIAGTPVPVTVTGSGASGVSVGFHGLLSNIVSTVSVNGTAGSMGLYVDNSADPVSRTVTLDRTHISFGGPGIFYGPTALTSLILEGGSGGGTYTIADTPSAPTTLRTRGNNTVFVQGNSSQLNINGQAASDFVQIGNGGHLTNILAPVSITNSVAFATRLTVDNSADSGNRTVTLGATQISFGGPGISYANQLRSLVLEGGSGTNLYTISDTPFTSANTTLRTRGNGDTVNVRGTSGLLEINSLAASAVIIGSLANSLDSIRSPVGVDASGNTTLTVNDQGSSTARMGYVIDQTFLTRAVTGLGVLVNYQLIRSLVLNAGSGNNDDIAINASVAALTTTINAGAGTTTVHAGSSTLGDLSPIRGPLTVNGQRGNTSLTLFDQSTTAAQTYTVTATSVTRTGGFGVTYAAIQNLTLNGGSGGNTISVLATPAATAVNLNAGAGNDTVNLGNNGSLQDIQGRAITVTDPSGRLSITVDDRNDTISQTPVLSTNPADTTYGEIAGLTPGPIYYRYANTLLTVRTGTTTPLVNVQATGTSTNVEGNDAQGTTINVGNAGSAQQIQGPLSLSKATTGK